MVSCPIDLYAAFGATLTFFTTRGFFIQCPLVLIGLILTELKLNISVRGSAEDRDKQSIAQKLKRVDFLGAFLLSITILGFLMFLHLGRQELGWLNLPVLSAAATSIIAVVAFLAVEKWYAVEPIFPLRLITHYAVFSSYTMLSMQTSAITSVSKNVRRIVETQLTTCR